jgi:hypothetical protein
LCRTARVMFRPARRTGRCGPYGQDGQDIRDTLNISFPSIVCRLWPESWPAGQGVSRWSGHPATALRSSAFVAPKPGETAGVQRAIWGRAGDGALRRWGDAGRGRGVTLDVPWRRPGASERRESAPNVTFLISWNGQSAGGDGLGLLRFTR